MANGHATMNMVHTGIIPSSIEVVEEVEVHIQTLHSTILYKYSLLWNGRPKRWSTVQQSIEGSTYHRMLPPKYFQKFLVPKQNMQISESVTLPFPSIWENTKYEHQNSMSLFVMTNNIFCHFHSHLRHARWNLLYICIFFKFINQARNK